MVARERAEGAGSRAVVISSNSGVPEDALYSVAGMVLCLNAAVITYAWHVAAKQEEGQQQQQQNKKKKKDKNKKQEQESQQQNLLQPLKEGHQQQQGDEDDAPQLAALFTLVGKSCSTCLNGLVHLVLNSPGSEVKSFASQNASVLVPQLLQLMQAATSRDVCYLVRGLMNPRWLDRQVGGKGWH